MKIFRPLQYQKYPGPHSLPTPGRTVVWCPLACSIVKLLDQCQEATMLSNQHSRSLRLGWYDAVSVYCRAPWTDTHGRGWHVLDVSRAPLSKPWRRMSAGRVGCSSLPLPLGRKNHVMHRLICCAAHIAQEKALVHSRTTLHRTPWRAHKTDRVLRSTLNNKTAQPFSFYMSYFTIKYINILMKICW